MPYDSSGYPVDSYYREDGMYIMNKADKEKWDEDTKRIDQGGGATIDLSIDDLLNLRR